MPARPIYALAVQPDGKIVAAGSASRSQQSGPGSGSEFALARYNADGTLDASFSGDGKVTKDIAGGQDYAYGVAVQADGKIVAVGSANLNAASFYTRFTLVRFNADGSLDTGFGSAGTVSTDFFGTENVATSVVIQPDGRIVVAGNAHDGVGRRFALARYNADGSLDASFGTGGKVTTELLRLRRRRQCPRAAAGRQDRRGGIGLPRRRQQPVRASRATMPTAASMRASAPAAR